MEWRTSEKEGKKRNTETERERGKENHGKPFTIVEKFSSANRRAFVLTH